MVRQGSPRIAFEQFRRGHLKPATIDAIQRQDGPPRGEGSRGSAGGGLKDLPGLNAVHQDGRGLAVPIVEIAGDEDRAIRGNALADSAAQGSDLLVSSPVEQVEMETEDMQGVGQSRQRDYGVQDASLFEPIRRDIEIFPFGERKLAEDGVSVVAAGVHGVFSVGIMRPDLVGQKFKLGAVGPAGDFFSMSFVVPQNLLKKDDVGVDASQGVAHSVQHIGEIAGGKTLVDVVGENLQSAFGSFFHFRVSPTFRIGLPKGSDLSLPGLIILLCRFDGKGFDRTFHLPGKPDLVCRRLDGAVQRTENPR